ncbi:DUF72 domain-containing protein [Pediococcus argentinicus]|uniref:DUF72 domain-containing protein n=1 Tax=Pediococcus argentinicus TaxID=480391 RepID=UPI00338E7794
MIEIGLSTWKDHPSLSVEGKEEATLTEYTGHFPIVEVDSSFYGIPRLSSVVNWQHQVPENFKFILKAYQKMTLHDHPNEDEDYLSKDRRIEFSNFKNILQPLIKAKQLEIVLFQFPPSFRCTLKNIRYLFEIRELMDGLPLSMEFRNHSWFDEAVRDDTIAYLKRLEMTHVIADEPFDGTIGIPLVPRITNEKLAFVRLHGRNLAGWTQTKNQPPHERTNYHYSTEELKRIGEMVTELNKTAQKVDIIFNNNGNHDAAGNAAELQEMLGLHFGGLGPVQMDLF